MDSNHFCSESSKELQVVCRATDKGARLGLEQGIQKSKRYHVRRLKSNVLCVGCPDHLWKYLPAPFLWIAQVRGEMTRKNMVKKTGLGRIRKQEKEFKTISSSYRARWSWKLRYIELLKDIYVQATDACSSCNLAISPSPAAKLYKRQPIWNQHLILKL